MNHIYKVVWSKVKNCYVVVSEIARSNGKTRSQKVVAVLGTALISSVLFTGGGDSLRLQRQHHKRLAGIPLMIRRFLLPQVDRLYHQQLEVRQSL